MNMQIIKKSAAIVSVALILFLIGLSVYFGMTGNTDAFFLVITSNAFFVTMNRDGTINFYDDSGNRVAYGR